MAIVPGEDCVMGGAAAWRVTRFGRILRQSRLDELPQIFNMLKGDVKVIGPRPPLPVYVSSHPEIYLPLLKEPPGVTGLATVLLCAREERILSACKSEETTRDVYRRRCLPVKARLDRLFLARRGPYLCCYILFLTIWRTERGRRVGRLLRRSGKNMRQKRPKRAAIHSAAVPQALWR
jgi:lipopolysaccharide/colanic/teichoic acid biosynthesis glycosyltransferase